MTYAIAAYFSLEARQSASAEHYTPPKGYERGYRRNSQGCCPLGKMLQVDGYGQHITQPGSSYAVSALIGRMEPIKGSAAGAERFRSVRTATAAFIADWDAGDIEDLAAALDCYEKRPPALPRIASAGATARKAGNTASLVKNGR